MQRSTVFAASAVLLAAFAVLTALFAVFRPNVGTGASRTAALVAAKEAREERLLLHMAFFQRYAEKLALANEAGNAPLATFYAEEIEETAERLMYGGHADDGVDLSAIAAEVAVPRAERLVAAARSGDRARTEAALAQMLDGCTACHRRSGHRWIVVQPPTGEGPYPSQSFTPVR